MLPIRSSDRFNCSTPYEGDRYQVLTSQYRFPRNSFIAAILTSLIAEVSHQQSSGLPSYQMNLQTTRLVLDENMKSEFFGNSIEAGNRDAYLIVWNYGRRQFIPWYRSLKLSRAEAEDLWSDTFLELLETNCKTFNPKLGPFALWLKTVAKTAGFYGLRKRRDHREVSLEQGYV